MGKVINIHMTVPPSPSLMSVLSLECFVHDFSVLLERRNSSFAHMVHVIRRYELRHFFSPHLNANKIMFSLLQFFCQTIRAIYVLKNAISERMS